ncbi:GNVR domain-containing protein [Hoeflea sp.]|uniref:GNVR domain-containing protein n=1 Tax=Hoeflea sp. TaxID=1940281 RepID=UPI0037494CF6
MSKGGPRISTSRYASRAPSREERPQAEAAPEHALGPESVLASEQQAAASPDRLFGDRIARLMEKAMPKDRGVHQRNQRPDERPEQRHHHEHHQEYTGEAAAVGHTGRAPSDENVLHQPDGAAWFRHQDWAQPQAAAWNGPDERPLLDPSILIAAVWRWRNLIAIATLLGALVGVMIALSTPHRYYAESRLFVDPREVRVTEDDVRNQQLSTEAILAIIDSQLQILSSTTVLEQVIAELGLAQDAEFNGSLSTGGLSGGIAILKEIITGKDPASDAEQIALEHLRDAVSVSRDTQTFVIIVGVDTRDPEKSALIANKIVDTYLDSEGAAQSGLLERTSEAIDTRINALRSDLDEAEREVERFKAENGIVGVGGGQSIDDKEILAISDQLANARAVKVGVRVKAQNLAKADPEEVLSGSFPEEFLSSNLIDLRKQYTQTKSTADSLATQLGPRHPQYVSAQQSLETIRAEITRELRRIVASSQSELQRAVETEQELASQMAVAKSRAMDQSVEFVTLRELERKATATREIYEAFLRRSRETSERSNLSTRNVRVISPAEAPLNPMGPSRKFIAAGGMVGGFFLGLGLALLAGALESIRAFSAAGRPPGAPQFFPDPSFPDPRTPPGGAGRKTRSDQGDASSGHNAPAAQGAEAGYAASRAKAERQDAMEQDLAANMAEAAAQAIADTEPKQSVEPQPDLAAQPPVQPPVQTQVQPQAQTPVQPAASQAWSAPQPSGMHPDYPPHPQTYQGQPYPPQLHDQQPHQQAFAHPAPYPAASQYGGQHGPQSGAQHGAAMPGFVPAAMVPQQPVPQPWYPVQQNFGYPAAQLPPAHPHAVPHPASVNWPGSLPVMPHQPISLQQQAYPAAVPPVAPPAYPPQPVAAPAAPQARVQAQDPVSSPAPAQVTEPARVADPDNAAPSDPEVDRIRRQMDQLRSRIGGHPAARRRA